MDLSSDTLALAMLALVRDLEATRKALETQTDQDVIDDESQRCLDMLKALNELDSLYEDHRAADPSLPASSVWLPPILP